MTTAEMIPDLEYSVDAIVSQLPETRFLADRNISDRSSFEGLNTYSAGYTMNQSATSCVTVSFGMFVMKAQDSNVEYLRRAIAITDWRTPTPIDIHHRWMMYVEPQEYLVLNHAIPRNVLRFCFNYGLYPYFHAALELFASKFSHLEDFTAQVQHDPEGDSAWVIIKAIVRGEVEQVHEAYEEYIGDWVHRVPLPERDMIRLSLRLT